MKKSTTQPATAGNEQEKEKTITMDLPEVKDIPGQEHIVPPDLRQFADTTISSDDEEGKGIVGFNDEDDDLDDAANVSNQERELLERSATSTGADDDEDQRNAQLDNVDDDGEALNESVDNSGSDLDVPGSEDDDDNEELGEEDEENNSYSLGGDKD